MANKVDVEINGKDNLSRAASSSSKSLETLAHTMMGPVELFKQLSSAATAFIASFSESEQGIKRLNFAIESTGSYTSGASDRLVEYANAIKAKTGIDEDEIIALENKLIVEGKSEEQTRRMVQVAVDYAAATGQDLTSALTAVEQAQIGSLKGQLKYFEGMKDLTKEQLANGDALDLIERKTKGYAETLASGTVQGSINRMKNAFEDMQKSLGASLAPILTQVFNGLTWLADAFTALPAPVQLFIGVVGGLTVAFIAVQAAVAAFGVTLNVALGPISLVIGGIAALGAGISAMQSWYDGIGQSYADLSKGILDTHSQAAAAIGPLNSLTANQKLSAEQVSKLIELYPELNGVIKAGITTTKEASEAELKANLIKQISLQIEVAKERQILLNTIRARGGFGTTFELAELKKLDDRFHEVGATVQTLKDEFANLNTKANEAPAALDNAGKAADKLKDKYADLRKYILDAIEAAGKANEAFLNAQQAAAFSLLPIDVINGSIENVTDLLARLREMLPSESEVALMNEEQLNKYRELVLAIADAERRIASYKDAARISAELEAAARKESEDAQNNLPGPSIKSESLHVGNRLGKTNIDVLGEKLLALGPITKLFSSFSSLASTISSISAIYNWQQTILEGAMKVLAPLVDSILAPVVGALRIIGELLGKVIAPILSVLGPIVTILAEVFVWLYNKVIIPLGNVVIFVFNIIYNAAVWIYNWFHWGAAAMQYKPLSGEGSGMLTEISTSDLSTAGSTSGGGSGGGSTTYSKPRDITINVTVNTPALVGEGGFRQFALTVNKELKLALASGAT